MKSTSGYDFSLGSVFFSWASMKQATVAQSIAEAEYVAASEATSQVIWIRRILGDMGEQADEPTIMYLEKLSFDYCKNLITLDSSIGYLNKLEILDAWGCNKLESFPPLRLRSLKELEVTYCSSLKSFPELLCKMTNIKDIRLYYTSIEELPFSFQYLNELRSVTMRPVEDVMVRLPEHNGQVFPNLECLALGSCNLSDECLPIVLKCCVNVTFLWLKNNNFKILPECLSECHLLTHLYLDCCRSLEEIRGFPPNLIELSAIGCESLSSSCRRILLSQKLNEAGCTDVSLPNGTEGIPDWFEHQIKGDTISFWFRKKIPSITSILLLPGFKGISRINLFVNGNYLLDYLSVNRYISMGLDTEHAFLCDLKLEEQIQYYKRSFLSEMKEALLKSEWIHVELKLSYYPGDQDFNTSEDEKIKILSTAQMGIQVLKDKRNLEEEDEDVIFTNPYSSRKRKLDEYLNASFSQKKRKQTNFSIPMDLVSGMQNLVLTETKRKRTPWLVRFLCPGSNA